MLDIDKLAAALAKAQAEIVGAEKSRTNPAFKSKYATLADVWDACRKPLTANGLSVVQLVRATSGGVEVETKLLHTSGQSLSATLGVPVDKNTAQGIGSAITYARRYGLSAMVGVCPDEDDDGHAATQSNRRDDYQREERRELARGHQQAPASGSTPAKLSEKEVDAAIAKVFSEIRGIIPEITAATLRSDAGFAATGKLSIDQRTVLLRSMEQRLKSMHAAMEGDPPPEDDIPF
jgi:hypothetical protein